MISVYNMDWTAIVVAVIGFFGIFSGSYFSYLCQRHSRQINDAVNRRHKDHPKLYDLILQNNDKTHELDFRLQRIEDRFLSLPCRLDETDCSEES